MSYYIFPYRLFFYFSVLFNYLNQTWLDKYKEMFVSLWTNKVLHLGNHMNNRVESQLARFKNYLDSNHSKLHRFFEYIDKIVKSQYTAIKWSLEKSRIQVKHLHTIYIFKCLWCKVSQHALQNLFQELDRPKF